MSGTTFKYYHGDSCDFFHGDDTFAASLIRRNGNEGEIFNLSNHYCPVKRDGESSKAMTDAGFRAIEDGVDLNGKMGDVHVLDILEWETGAIYVMDRGYLDFDRLYVLHQGQAFFVTRAKSSARLRRVTSALIDRSRGSICVSKSSTAIQRMQ